MNSDHAGTFFAAFPTNQPYYGSLFNGIEINRPFYTIPLAGTVKRWVEEVPQQFTFTFKLWRGITHVKALAYFDEDLHRFMQAIRRRLSFIRAYTALLVIIKEDTTQRTCGSDTGKSAVDVPIGKILPSIEMNCNKKQVLLALNETSSNYLPI
ncbi:DUF72 domain-containing protein [Chitinophaga rhizosphaerae]|uniref:DUF72 domain-containing protein n=1 Tax=Chitinophaga rhizosphaerae TaxID=1864947 RepID=UPI000F801D7A|nr:DUF72 domain-containing protein [Chitinophaga rhizosphaerae]